jgi:hypothetical protein
MSATTINTKVYIKPGQQVRRLRVSTETSFEAFRGLILNAYESSPLLKEKEYDAQFLYLDDEEDWISINTEREFQDALSYFESGDELFRVKVVIVTKEKQQHLSQHPWSHQRPQHHHHRFHPTRCFRAPWQIFDGVNQQQVRSSETPVHTRQHSNDILSLLDELFVIPGSQQTTQKKSTAEAPVHKKQSESVDPFSGLINELFDALIGEKPESQQPHNKPKAHSSEIPIDEQSQPAQAEVHVEQQLVETQESVSEQPEHISNENPESPQPVAEEQSFQQELHSLEIMGFTNKSLNFHLLNHHKGDLVKVISQLLELTH